jgi:ubiquinone/menaquinone biosynthesis C-methylase UbiE
MLKYDFQLVKSEYLKGNNVIDFLKQTLKIDQNTSEIIEVSYDLQAGTYVKHAMENLISMEKIGKQCAEIIKQHVESNDNILDLGTGEITTFSFLISKLPEIELMFYACDISLSRLLVGRKFVSQFLSKELFSKLKLFCADMLKIPILDNSIDIVTSYHSLEPNGGKEEVLLKEIFRICRKKVILFEPSYELNTHEGKKRMDKHGYIKSLPTSIKKLGGKLEETILMEYQGNELNLTAAYIITPPLENIIKQKRTHKYADPGENSFLTKIGNCYFSPNYGVAYPIVDDIPILKEQYAILASAMEE